MGKGLAVCAIAWVSLGGALSCLGAEPGIEFRKDVFKRHEDGYHTYRIPTMVVTASGKVLVFCEGRKTSRRDSGDVDLLMKSSEDGGRTWSKQILIHEEGGDAPIRVGNPCPIVDRAGMVVHLLFTRGGGECFYYTRSNDEGATWSPLASVSDDPREKEYREGSFLSGFGGSPVTIGVGPVHGIHTSKGRLIAPSYIGHKVEGKSRGQSAVIFSDDGGETWQAGGAIPWVEEFRPGECTVVERSDGSLLMNMRAGAPDAYSFGYRVVSTSNDAGMTWTRPVVERSLPDPACQGSMLRLDEKRILFLNPAVHHRGGFAIWSRHNLTLRVSEDEGKSWTSGQVLNKGLAGYSDMAITPAGKILCLFENGTKDYCEKITILQVDPSSLGSPR